MSTPLFDELEIISLTNDINERENIINRYHATGQMDRNDAIEKIKKLRITDREVFRVTAVFMPVNAIPFEQCTNEQLVNELKMQVNILKGKLSDKVQGDNDNANT